MHKTFCGLKESEVIAQTIFLIQKIIFCLQTNLYIFGTIPEFSLKYQSLCPQANG